jgi:citrate lyase subunit beta / citryl-CoA lyase
MKLRSLLFVPGDRPLRMEKAAACGADAVILDLEDSVASAKKSEARGIVAQFLSRSRAVPIFVRVNPASLEEDLAAIIPGRPSGIMLPKAGGAASVEDLDRRLTSLGDTECVILPIVTETPAAIFALSEYRGRPRLCGLAWGVEDLSAAIGASPRKKDGAYTKPFETARALMLFAAHAAKVPAIETIYPALNDEAGLQAYAARGRRDGFSGMLAIHPSQVAIINAAFTPSPEEIQWARKVADAFAADPDKGALQMDGRMLDAPHLLRAKAILNGLDN